MLLEESQWIKTVLEKYFGEGQFPMLNVGSSTAEFRQKTQPHMHELIFSPLEQKHLKVYHTDIKAQEGVDLVGDLNDEKFQERLKALNVRSVLCSNLLEHLEDPQRICDSILRILKKDDLIIVTVPHYFPYHKDPIDTMLRPDVQALAKFFPGTTIMEGMIVSSNKNLLSVYRQNLRYFMIMLLRFCLPFYKTKEWRLMIRDLFSLRKRFSATCLLLRIK